MDLLIYLGTVSARFLCPGEVTTLKYDHGALRNGDEIEDVVWSVKDVRKWTNVAYCNGSLVCILTKSEVANGVKLLGISNGALTITRTTGNDTTSHMDFKCEIHNRSHTLTHQVKIKLHVECKSNSRGGGHMIRLEMLVVSLRCIKKRFWSYIECSSKYLLCCTRRNCNKKRSQLRSVFWLDFRRSLQSGLLAQVPFLLSGW